MVTHGIEAKCASPRWRPNPEIDWHRDRYPRDMINPAGRNHVIRQRSPSSNAINKEYICLYIHLISVLISSPCCKVQFAAAFSVLITPSRSLCRRIRLQCGPSFTQIRLLELTRVRRGSSREVDLTSPYAACNSKTRSLTHGLIYLYSHSTQGKNASKDVIK